MASMNPDLSDKAFRLTDLQFFIESFFSRDTPSGFLNLTGDLLHSVLTISFPSKSISCVFSKDWHSSLYSPVHFLRVAIDVQAKRV
jgi:hypothetical protein